MAAFMIYLLETGICLALLYLAYWLFLRKETYFNFNRLFLLGSIVLALTVPYIHFSIIVPQGSSLENPARSVLKFRQGYGDLIRYMDADFGTEPGSRHSEVRHYRGAEMEQEGLAPSAGRHGSSEVIDGLPGDRELIRARSRISVSGVFLIIYIGGVIYFFARFVYLVIRLYLLAKRNRVSRQDGFRMVEIEEEISPFSFFRFLFINNGVFTETELGHVLEHEKAHMMQRHTTDHLFAHGLAVFQWFNPFAWQIRKALKSTHEYIADRRVIDRGFERRDYQALLLKQVIGYHSVELVNNFNLKPIKNRIAMMNKNRSGLPARLKAVLVAPFAILIFFLFADFTLTGNERRATIASGDLQGLWIGQTADKFSKALLIKDNHFSYTEGVEIRNYLLRIQKGDLMLSEAPGRSETALRFEVNGRQLTLWWNDEQSSQYIRSAVDNTLDNFLETNGLKMSLPYISQYRLLENEALIYRLGIGLKDGGGVTLSFDGQPMELDELSDRVDLRQDILSKMDQGNITALFLVDREVPMAEVTKVREVLRKMETLHFAEGGYPQGDLNLSPLIYNSVALPRLLPPANAMKLDKKEMERLGGDLYTIDLSARNTTPGDVDAGLRDFISGNDDGRYVISLEYDGAIPYGQYVETVDMVWKIVYTYRNNLAMDRYRVPYDKLGEDLQRQIRTAYPMALSETMN